MIKYYESLLLYEKSILVILEAVYSSRFIKVLRSYLNVTMEGGEIVNFRSNFFIHVLINV